LQKYDQDSIIEVTRFGYNAKEKIALIDAQLVSGERG